MSATGCVAIVGAGPKGLYCLERLAIELEQTDTDRIGAVHIFEPHPIPGAGPVYDPSQPPWLRLNFANAHIDAWSRCDDMLDDPARPTFVEFLEAEHPTHADPAGYAPRALVGDYLHSTFSAVVARLATLTAVQVHAEPVLRIAREAGRFALETPTTRLLCDEALIATGHASRRAPTSLGHSGRALGPYPLDGPGGVSDIAPDGRVAVRGMGLTAIDVALALTEGRGGSFVPGAVPGQLVYNGSSSFAGTILPFSRTGRPMVPKDHPEFGPPLDTEDIDETVAGGRELITALQHREPTPAFEALESCLVATGAQLLSGIIDRPVDPAVLAEQLDELCERRPVAPRETLRLVQQGVDVAYGRREPTPEWALGTTWRLLYPAIVELFATRALDDVWPRFGALATEMERVAFGPPAENAARVRALVEAGVVDLSMASGATILPRREGFTLQRNGFEHEVDELVGSVLAPPGVRPEPSLLIASILDGGLARPMPQAPGLEVLRDGTCIGRTGEPTRGLAAIGRPTEGCVLGNDTLGRTLHDTPMRWARAAVQRLTARKEVLCA